MTQSLGDRVRVAPLAPHMVDACAAIAQTAPDPWSAQSLAAVVENPGLRGFAALLNGAVLGFACYLVLDQSADLQLLAVREDARRQGVGRRLLGDSLAVLKNDGVKHCLLEMRASNSEALALYQRLGFRQMAVRKAMYKNPPEDGYLMGLKWK